MRVSTLLRITDDHGVAGPKEEVAAFEKETERPEDLALLMAEGKTLLAAIQNKTVIAQITEWSQRHRGCEACGAQRLIKGSYPIQFHTLYGDVEHARVREAIAELRAASVVLQKDVTEAAGSAVQDAFKGLQGDIERARGAIKWFSYRWLVIVGFSLAGMGALAVGLIWASLAWQRHEVLKLTEQRTAIEADIAEMQVNAEALAKKGARIKINDCGGRPCIEVSPNQSENLTDRTGPWNNSATGKSYVIPKGY